VKGGLAVLGGVGEQVAQDQLQMSRVRQATRLVRCQHHDGLGVARLMGDDRLAYRVRQVDAHRPGDQGAGVELGEGEDVGDQDVGPSARGGHALHVAVLVLLAGVRPFIQQEFADADDAGQWLT
jgi:hypothetical protein